MKINHCRRVLKQPARTDIKGDNDVHIYIHYFHLHYYVSERSQQFKDLKFKLFNYQLFFFFLFFFCWTFWVQLSTWKGLASWWSPKRKGLCGPPPGCPFSSLCNNAGLWLIHIHLFPMLLFWRLGFCWWPLFVVHRRWLFGSTVLTTTNDSHLFCNWNTGAITADI